MTHPIIYTYGITSKMSEMKQKAFSCYLCDPCDLCGYEWRINTSLTNGAKYGTLILNDISTEGRTCSWGSVAAGLF